LADPPLGFIALGQQQKLQAAAGLLAAARAVWHRRGARVVSARCFILRGGGGGILFDAVGLKR